MNFGFGKGGGGGANWFLKTLLAWKSYRKQYSKLFPSPLGKVTLTVTGGHYLLAVYCSVDEAEVQDPEPPRRIRFDRAKSNELC